MKDTNEILLEIRKYLKKLAATIDSEATFCFFKSRIFNKTKIDDLICCVEANFPEEYKKLLRSKSSQSFKSVGIYYSLKRTIQKKFFFSSSSYLIEYRKAMSLIATFSSLLDFDLKKLNQIH